MSFDRAHCVGTRLINHAFCDILLWGLAPLLYENGFKLVQVDAELGIHPYLSVWTKVRLTAFEVNAIRQSAQEVFGAGVEIILFGSRVDDDKKGGDIDLYIKAQTGNDLMHKIKFLLSLEEKIGEQKIDVVLAMDKDRPIEQQAMSTGIRL